MNAAADDVLALLRDDLRDFAGYRSARSETAAGAVWLNANEAARANAADADGSLRRYPPPQPEPLRAALAGLYGCSPERLLIGRGSDEAIDLLVRAFCRPGRDAVLVAPPVFGMYAVCARLQDARLHEVPLCERDGNFEADLDEIACVALEQAAKLVFLCSPGNPAGGVLSAADVLALAQGLSGHALVVVDEAYIEFADAPSLVASAASQANVVVLRTLSKAHALAAARIGCAIADARVVEALRRCQAPYPVPGPSAAQALAALTPPALSATGAAVAEVRSERARVAAALAHCPDVRRVYPSQANFLLARFADAAAAFERLLAAGIVVRDMRAMPQLGDALRITIGTPAQNDAALAALGRVEAAA
ncbi:histidinol-phosphate transaminase [Luteimonas sp. SX5]|uniref:Histidinol-phosphate aminotransferase n=1 Tax=Luteimonas galliterrae TaxID=2940486 RepID=A0ABT0MG89_9GAMM|nr:histidinol-phosphate transaminase [Luteimonas galliterrae]MCL1633899.1 histidinol-phosphate transaminase [Luteimonas galliterrae]